MSHSGCPPTPTAIPLTAEQWTVLTPLLPLLGQLAGVLLDFRCGPICPKASHDLEVRLAQLTRCVGRLALETTFNALEPDQPDQLPQEIRTGGTRYRRRDKSPHAVDSTFGTLRLRRWLYEPREPGERCLFPLQELLGLVAGRATPALADAVGRLVAMHPQREVLRLLKEENDLSWSHALLRQVAAEVAQLVEGKRQAAQAKQLIGWLRQAWRGRGRHEPVLAVGRDGILVPICGCQPYQEAAVATLAVYDRRGRRLGTVYLGWMPQALQPTLSRQLTALIHEVLTGWKGRRPRLAYITDGGQAPEAYYRQVLRPLQDPQRPGQRLAWQRVLDYYHASGYISKLAEALFGQTWRASWWSRRMRGVLRQAGGLTRLLQSASYHRNQQRLRGERDQEFCTAYNYLWKRRRHMDYAGYRAAGLPIGSGVTEAGCKVVVAQRLKLSGMKWKKAGGQVVLTLRVVWLSGLWPDVWNTHIQESVNHDLQTYQGCLRPTLAAAA